MWVMESDDYGTARSMEPGGCSCLVVSAAKLALEKTGSSAMPPCSTE